MIEAIVSESIAAIAAGAALQTRTSNRITDLDRRIDAYELRIATSYVPKDEFVASVKKIEDHMIRIENKIDQIVIKQR